MDTPPPAVRDMGPVDEVKPAEKPALPAYPAADFAKNLPAWAKAVAEGKKTASELLAMLSTRATFTEEQRAAVLALKAKPAEAQQPAADPPWDSAGQNVAGNPEHDEFVSQMNAAEDQQQ